MDDFNNFLRGGIAMGHLVAGLFFLRFYFRIGDRLFLMFSGAFWLMGLIRVGMIFIQDPKEQYFLHWIRFLAYLLILVAILDKNFPRETEMDDSLKDVPPPPPRFDRGA